MKKILMAEGCPAEAIRKYIERLRDTDEKELPGKIILSKGSLERIDNGLVKEMWDKEKKWEEEERECLLVWEEDDNYPALEVILKVTKKGEGEVLYMKEAKTKTAPEFTWESNERKNEILVAKDKSDIRDGKKLNEPDALEDIIDMDDKDNIPEVERD